MSRFIDAATLRRLLLHEAQVHAVPGRELRDLGDALLLVDPVDPEPFWNRLEAVRWPDDPSAFDRRLAEASILFASFGRQPHFWVSPPQDRPADLAARLAANGFEDVGPGHLMVVSDDRPAHDALAEEPPVGTTLEQLSGIGGADAIEAAGAIVSVLLAAFGVEEERRPSVAAETAASLADDRFTHYLLRVEGEPAAVARRATFDGLSYLSSIGAVSWARGRGLGRLVTASAVVDGIAAGSEWIHLGVFADNLRAIGLYRRLGFRMSGHPGPDMVLVG